MRQIGPLARLSATPLRPGAPALPLAAAPAWKGSSPSGESGGVPATGGPPPKSALDDLLVLDFATWIAGAFAAVPLADLGARVIKVEPLEGDPFRSLSATRGEGVAKTSQGKEGLAVDLKTAEGRAIVHQLVRRADILIHNY